MKRIVFAVVMLSLAATACTRADTDSTQSESATTSSTTTTQAEATEAPSLLAITTSAGEVVVLEGGEDEVSRITPPDGSFYRQPVFVDRERILFAEGSPSGSQALLLADATSGDIEWRTETDTSPFYYLPAPAGGDVLSTSLRNDPQAGGTGGGLIAELVLPDGTLEPVSDEFPFYSAWSPDGSQLAIHRSASVLSILTDGSEEVIGGTIGLFQAPVWTSDGLITLRTTSSGEILSVWDGEGFRDVVRIDGATRFVVGDGVLAIQAIGDREVPGISVANRAQQVAELPGGMLLSLDLATGESETILDELSPFYQWDPTGTRLLFSTVEQGETTRFAWWVWEDGQVSEHGDFVPSPIWFRDVVPFFDQYDQSAPIWDATGDAFAYPAIESGQPVVVVQSFDGGTSTIPDAVWAAWSP